MPGLDGHGCRADDGAVFGWCERRLAGAPAGYFREVAGGSPGGEAAGAVLELQSEAYLAEVWVSARQFEEYLRHRWPGRAALPSANAGHARRLVEGWGRWEALPESYV